VHSFISSFVIIVSNVRFFFPQKNYDFLLSEGFSVEEVTSCLILLSHDPESLQHYYATLWSRPEVVAYKSSEAWQDKTRVLSLLQYLMEKDMNFTSTVFHADVEYGGHDLDKQDKDVASEGRDIVKDVAAAGGGHDLGEQDSDGVAKKSSDDELSKNAMGRGDLERGDEGLDIVENKDSDQVKKVGT
jgi:hypothetical protein